MKRGSAAGTRLRFPIQPLRSYHRGMDRTAKRDCVLTIIAAKEIKKSSSRPNFYVATSCDGKPRLRTQELQDVSPTWSDPRPLSALPGSILSFHLKQCHTLLPYTFVGSVEITVAELLKLCDRDEQTTLELHDKRNKLVALLILKLRESDALQAGRVAVSAARRDITEREIAEPKSIPDSIGDAVVLAASADAMASPLVNSLKQVVNKTKFIVDFIDKTTKLHPYADAAWRAVSLAYNIVRAQLDRDQKIEELVITMERIYSFVDVAGDWKSKIRPLEDTMIIITEKTRECAEFIQEYASHKLAGRMVHQTISQADATISSLLDALQGLEGELDRAITLNVAIVSSETRDNIDRLLLELLKPASMDASTRQPCLDGTRIEIRNELIGRLSRPHNNLHCQVVWVFGLAGSGKSTLLNSIAEHFRALGQCGAFVFFDRSDPVNSDPSRVIPTLAYHLARFSPLFARNLDEQIQARRDIFQSSLPAQFQTLLEEPSKAVAALTYHSPIIIIIDGLDECGTERSRKPLLEILSKRIQNLAPVFQILVASRDEKDIRFAFSPRNINATPFPLPTGDDATSRDIAQYFQKRLRSIAECSELAPDWPGPEAIEKLTECAGGLFIWASTAVAFIEDGLLPEDRLPIVLNLSTQGKSLTKLHELYQVTLAEQFKSLRNDELEIVRQVLGAIVVTRERLTDEVLSGLLGLEQSKVQRILSRLRSLLQWSPGEPIIVLHASFPDFLGDPGQCTDSRWHIDLPAHHRGLATGCFGIMRGGLRFNICGLETSYFKNKAIDGIEERIDQNITADLMYGCQYWADHLDLGLAGDLDGGFSNEISIFLRERFLFWLEVFSLKDRCHAVSTILSTAANWCKEHGPELGSDISDAQRFVRMFGHPISRSVPHVYLSALPFSPSGSSLIQHWNQEYPNTLVVEVGRPKTWPAILHILHINIPLSSAAFSPDGTCIVLAGWGKTIQLWDAASGTAIAELLEGHSDFITSVAFSPDGARIVSGSHDNTIRLWDVKSGTAIGEPLQGHTGSVTSVAFSPDGTRFVSGSHDNTIRFWDAGSGSVIGEPLQGHTSVVVSVAFSPDGTRIVSGSIDKTIQLWDAASGTAIGESLRGHSGPITSVAFSRDGTRIASGSNDKTIRLWDAGSGTVIGEPLQGHSDSVASVASSPDGTRIVSGSHDMTIQLWDAGSMTAIGEPLQGHTDAVTFVSFSPDSTYIISGSYDGTIRLWDARSATAIAGPPQGHSDSVTSVAFSPDSTRIVSGSRDNTIRLWDAASGTAIGKPLQGHSDWVRSVAFSPDGTHIVSGSDNNTIQLWDAGSGTAIGEPVQGHSSYVMSVAFSPDGTRIVSGSNDLTVRLWDAGSRAAIGEPLHGHSDWVTSVAFSPDGTRIVSGSHDKTVRLWDTGSRTAIGVPLQGHSNVVRSVAFTPDGTCIVSGSFDNTVRLWDAASGAAIGEPLRGHFDSVRSVAVSPDGTRIVSGSDDNTIRLWDAKSGTAIGGPLEGHSAPVTSVAFSPDGTCIISCSGDKAIRLWDVALCKATGELPQDYSGTVIFSVPSADVPREPGPFATNSPLDDDGWVTMPDGELIFWVPPDNRLGLMRPGTLKVLGAAETRIDVKNFVHGVDWTRCRRNP